MDSCSGMMRRFLLIGVIRFVDFEGSGWDRSMGWQVDWTVGRRVGTLHCVGTCVG